MSGVVERADAYLAELLGGWNVLSTAIAIIIGSVVFYSIYTAEEPDTHPLLLSRQANVALVRQPGESATHRSTDVPFGFPLKSGLNVKTPGAPKWSSGRDGDLRDVWRRAVGGVLSDNGEPTKQVGKILTIYGRENVVDHDLSVLSKEINIIGQYVKDKGATCVGVYLPNSVEALSVVFGEYFV